MLGASKMKNRRKLSRLPIRTLQCCLNTNQLRETKIENVAVKSTQSEVEGDEGAKKQMDACKGAKT